MLKKLCIGICCIMALFMFGCTPDNGEPEGSEINVETDLSLTATVDKTTANVGDTIEITVTLKNLSGKDLYIALTNVATEELKDRIRVVIYPDGEEFYWSEDYAEIWKGYKKVLAKDAIVQRVIEHQVTEQGIFNIHTYVSFHMGKEYDRLAAVYGELIQIEIGG